MSDGGLAQTLVEMALRRGVGATVDLSAVAEGDPFVALFSESVARAVVAVPADGVDDLLARASSYRVPVTRLGTTGGDALTVTGTFEVSSTSCAPPTTPPCPPSSPDPRTLVCDLNPDTPILAPACRVTQVANDQLWGGGSAAAEQVAQEVRREQHRQHDADPLGR